MDDRVRRAIEAVLAVAESNFPSATDIRIEATGKNTASIVVPSYELRRLMERK